MKNYLIIFFFIPLLKLSTLYSQNIKVLFNQSVDNSISLSTDAVKAQNIEDTICDIISSATNSVDIAVWDNGSSKIVNALNAVYNKGVNVRYISSSNSLNSALSGLNNNISVLKRNASITTNVMHNKFIVIDNQQVLTGSMNFGNGSMFDDYNNIAIISNPTLAQNYTIEFEEMWGGTGLQPNTSNSKFGPAKSDNTQHNFVIGNTDIELYFSPTDNTTNKIIEEIDSADYTIEVAMFTFINNDLGDALVDAKQRGVYVKVIIENINYIGSEYAKLLAAGINVQSHENTAHDFHHKYCIIDANAQNSNPTVITGSHNWTSSAETDNDENTLIIHDFIIAQQYLEEFSKRFDELTGINEDVNGKLLLDIFPNPSKDKITIINKHLMDFEVSIFDYQGKLIQENKIVPAEASLHLKLQKGIYIVRFTSKNISIVRKIIFI